MIAPKHILGTFDEALASLRNNVLMMAGLTERSLDRAMKGLFQRDDDLCTHAIADDEEIDQLEKQIDKDGVDVLLRFQPVASDLRRGRGLRLGRRGHPASSVRRTHLDRRIARSARGSLSIFLSDLSRALTFEPDSRCNKRSPKSALKTPRGKPKPLRHRLNQASAFLIREISLIASSAGSSLIDASWRKRRTRRNR